MPDKRDANNVETKSQTVDELIGKKKTVYTHFYPPFYFFTAGHMAHV